MSKIIAVDDFFDDPQKELEQAKSAEYKTEIHNGLEYEGICKVEDDAGFDKISKITLANFSEKLCMYRQYLPQYHNKTYIHNDVLISTFSAVAFLTPDESATGGFALWKHRALGWEANPTKEECYVMGLKNDDYFNQVYRDGFDEDMWEMIDYVPMKFNRCVIFHGARYHSRYPQKQSGNRLIKVYFGKS